MGTLINSVVDSFMAMLSGRPYRHVKAINEAVKEIQNNSGIQFDPKVVESFLKIIVQPEVMQQLKKLTHRGKK